MKNYFNYFLMLATAASLTFLASCGKDDVVPDPQPTGTQAEFPLSEAGGSGVSGTVTFAKLDDNSTMVSIKLNNTSGATDFAAHIHNNTIAETGEVAISLSEVNASTGISETNITAKDDGTAISYEELLIYNGYVNVHKADGSSLASGDIGVNVLTGASKMFDLSTSSSADVTGTASFWERASGATLVVVKLEGVADGTDYASHIHMNTVAAMGGVAMTLSNVVNGWSYTSISAKDDGTAITYTEMLAYNGYVNVHKTDGSSLIAGDIGRNELTGASKTYELPTSSSADITGTASFWERVSGETLVVVKLVGVMDGSDYASHIHMNTIAEAGAVAMTLSNIVNGWSYTSISAKDDGTAITYTELLAYNGYVNVHNTDGSSLIAGDIGRNELTGASKTYELPTSSNADITGTASFWERASGETLVVVNLVGVMDGSDYASHIHLNTLAETGGVAMTLSNVVNGWSYTSISTKNDGTAITYTELLAYNGYVNVHNTDGSSLIAGDIGRNELTGEAVTYNLSVSSSVDVTGTAKFWERASGETLVVVNLLGVATGTDYASHIHMNTVAATGGVVMTLSNVVNGWSYTSISTKNDGTAITYTEMIAYNGYVNVHKTDGSSLIAGNIGSNG